MDEFESVGPISQRLMARLKTLNRRVESAPEDDPNGCPFCDGYGNIIDENGARPCRCVLQLQELRHSRLTGARIPAHYRKKDLDNFNAEKPHLKACLTMAREYVYDYSSQNKRGLYIHGMAGCGKTHLAVGVLKGLIARGFDGVFYNLTDLFDQMRTSLYGEGNINAHNALLRDLERDILILDDVAAQKHTAWVGDRLYSFINYRYQNCKTLILTTNLSPKDFTLKMGEVLASRVFSMCREIEVQADDYRARMNRSGKNIWP